MMKKIFISTVAILLLVAVVFCALWISEKNDRSDMEELCQYSVSGALVDFTEFEKGGADGQYWSAVSHFGTYIDAWTQLGGTETVEYSWCNELYGYMLLKPQAVQENLGELLKALEDLDDDYLNPNGHDRIRFINHIIAE